MAKLIGGSGIFQSTPSVWRETSNILDTSKKPVTFQSTPSVWRETGGVNGPHHLATDFNPLPPCGGRRHRINIICVRHAISIHSLRVEGDSMKLAQECIWEFQSTPSVWRETRNG